MKQHAIQAVHTESSGYRFEAFKRPIKKEGVAPFCCLVYSPAGALILGIAGEGESLIEALVDGAIQAGRHNATKTIHAAAKQAKAVK